MNKLSSTWIDISMTLKSGMVHWPGDPPVKISMVQAISRGHAANVSKLNMGSHTGTHMDAPYHFIQWGKGIDQMPLDATIGKARAIEIHDSISIKPLELKKHRIQKGERILFKTKNSSRSWKKNSFDKNFVYISIEAAKFLSKCRLRTVGVDYLSVGGYHEDGAATHRTLLKAGIWIVEGLNLSKVKEGTYEFICLPLKLSHGDGAPARAVLKRLRS